MKKIQAFEPWFFLFFGAFHLHRIWGIIDRQSYAGFWVGVMLSRGVVYYLLMGILAGLCVLGIVTFVKNWRCNFWWRWIYIFGGGYLLFDLLAIATGMAFWQKLILKMYDVSAWYWNVLWLGFIIMGGFSFALGIMLLMKQRKITS